jgi:hypothetical protein
MDETQSDSKYRALELSLRYHGLRTGTDDDIIATARKFESFLSAKDFSTAGSSLISEPTPHEQVS